MKQTNAIQVFNFEGNDTRVIDIDGQPWWIAKDVCSILGFENPSDATKYLEDDEKALLLNPSLTNNPNGQVCVLSEAGLYSLIMRSRKPSAKPFKRWVTHDILPVIRKHGVYMTPQKIEEFLTNPDNLYQIVLGWKQEKEKRVALEATVEQSKPLVQFAEAVQGSKTSILIGELAKLLKQNGVDIGQNRLFEDLRKKGFLTKAKGERRNTPTQKSIEMGLFEIRESIYIDCDGNSLVNRTTLVTGKGQIYFVNYYLGKRRAVA